MDNLFTHGYALLIGVGADLPATVNDATKLKEVLIKRGVYIENHVELLVESRATRENILAMFDQFSAKVAQDPNATAIVYFSGHGYRPAQLKEPNEHYLVPFGYDPSHRSQTAISGAEFTEKVEAIHARKLVVFLDCCHAGGMPQVKDLESEANIPQQVPPDLTRILESGSGRVIIASSHDIEKSYLNKEKTYSIFTVCLLEALAGRGSNSDVGYARILDTLIYLFDEVPKRALGPQHPLLKKVLDLGDNFPICYYSDKQIPQDKAKGAFLTVGQLTRKQREIESLRQQWDLLAEKVSYLNSALILESSAIHRFPLERRILEDERSLAELGDKLDIIEQIIQQSSKV